ncbi:MAG: hypothetical protein AAF721_03960 [Myxococcota bacterium]
MGRNTRRGGFALLGGVALAALAWRAQARPSEPSAPAIPIAPIVVQAPPVPVAEPAPAVADVAPVEPVVVDPRSLPATKAAAKILDLRETITESLTETKYQHRTVVRRREGVFLWDCSGMVAWMLRRAAPAARKALDKGRPVARDFYRHIRRAPTKRAKNGWKRLAHIEDVQPGDVFAWQRPPNFPSKSTGHVGFAVERPRPVEEWPGAYTLRILDATSLRHDDDTRPRGGDGGWGEGTILFMTDGAGHGTAYGWFGRRSRGVIETEIVFGRLTR